MSLKNIMLVILMIINCLFSMLLYEFYEYELILSVAIVLNIGLSFLILKDASPERYVVKLSIVYLAGFVLFICGRNIANILGVDDIYCFEFGYKYCLNNNEILKSSFLVNFSLIFFLIGFCYNNKKVVRTKDENNKSFFLNKNILKFVFIIALFSGLFSFYLQIQTIIVAINQGYLALYEGQTESYETPLGLLINIIFISSLSIVYCTSKNAKPILFYTLFLIYVVGQILTVLTGARSGFITALIVMLWLFLGSGKVGFKKILIIFSFIPLVFFSNYFASLSKARVVTNNGGLYEKIVEEVFYGQGISMMVFNIGTLEGGYPFLAYLKTIFPGIQVIFSLFSDIQQYQLSFSHSLTYRLAPSVYYDNMGWGWTLLGDFYAFSFGFPLLFLFYNFLWGKVLFKVSALSNSSTYYKGLFFCFLLVVFSISRASISYLIFLVFLYSILYFSLKFKFRI